MSATVGRIGGVPAEERKALLEFYLITFNSGLHYNLFDSHPSVISSKDKQSRMEKTATPTNEAPVAVFGSVYLHASWKASSVSSLPSIKAVVEKYKQKTGIGLNRMFGMNKEKKFLGIDMLRGVLCYAANDVELMGKIGSYKEIPFDTILAIRTDLSKAGKYKLEIRTSKREYSFKFMVLGDWVEFLERLKHLHSRKDDQPLYPITLEYLNLALSVKGAAAERDAASKPPSENKAQEPPTLGMKPDTRSEQEKFVPPKPIQPHINPILAIGSNKGGVKENHENSKPAQQNGLTPSSPRDPETKVVRVKSKEKANPKHDLTDESQEEGDGHRDQQKAVNEIVKQRKNV